MSKLLITNKLSDNRFLTPEGYMVIKNCILSKVGAQEYRKNEVFSCDSDEIISINRTEEEVFNENSLASFTGKPITLEHPSTDVNPENHNELSMGHIIEVRRRILPDGTKVVEGDIMITNQEAIDIIQDGEMTDLSVGYDCDIVDEENPQQRNIRVNHLALCKEGRAGIAHIADSKMKDYQLPSESFKRMENIPIQARKELKESDNPKATLLSYKSAIEDIINSADPDIHNKLKSMGNKIINDLKNQFKIDDSVEDIDRNTEEMAKKKYQELIRKYNELDKEYDYYADKPSNPNSVKKAEEIASEMGEIEKEIDEMKKKFNGILDSIQDYAPDYAIWVKKNGKWLIWGGYHSEAMPESKKQAFLEKYEDVIVVKNGESPKDSCSEDSTKDSSKYSLEELRNMRVEIYKGTDIYKVDGKFSTNPNVTNERFDTLEEIKKHIDSRFKDSIKDSNFEEYLDHLSKFGVKYKEVPNNRSNGIAYEVSYIKYATGLEIVSTAKKFGKRIISQEPGRIVIGDSIKDSLKKYETYNGIEIYIDDVMKNFYYGLDTLINAKTTDLDEVKHKIDEELKKKSTKDSKLAKIVAIFKKVKSNKQ